MITVAVLGPVEIRRDGELLRVPAGRTTEVLVRLALEAGQPVRAERIIEDLWIDAAGTARNTLQSKVSQLRRALGEPGLIAGGHDGYTLAVDPDHVDAFRVVDLAAAVSVLRRNGDLEDARHAAEEALSLFRGEILADAGDGEWLPAHRTRLEEIRLGIVEDRLAARVDLGADGGVVGELEALLERHPLREGLWSSLITALYRTGRQADALWAYTRVRRVLVGELGIEPGPDLQLLHARILRRNLPGPGPGGDLGPAETPPPAPPPPGNLPALTSPLVGREAELTDLRSLLRQQRLVTVVGPAGVGKTRTAVEVARTVDLPGAGLPEGGPAGGTWIVRLDAADSHTSLPQTVAETLHVSGGERMLLDRLRTARTLLVLDNCEHVVDAAADLTTRLLDAVPGLRVLATSQVPLGLDGECVYPLQPLPIADAVELFVNRAERMRHRFELDPASAVVADTICRTLDGLPLAIELAAARVRSLSVQEIARRLDDRFVLLRDPASRRPERRRALAGAIGWSYDLLFPDDQRGLWALSCFAGSASLPAAEHVLRVLGVPVASGADVVGRLVDRSLVSVDVTADGSVRYRLLNSIGAFARERLRESGRYEEVLAAHASWFAGAAEQAADLVRGARQPECLALVRADRADIDAALTWSAEHDPLLGARIAGGFGWTWVVLGDGVAGAARLRGALSAAGDLATVRDQVAGLLCAGWLEASAGDLERADRDVARAVALAELLDDDRLRSDGGRHLAFLRIQQGRPAEALEAARTSLDLTRGLGMEWETAGSMLLAASASIMLGDVGAAVASADEAVSLLGPTGDAWAMVHAEAMLGAIAQAAHRFDAADAYLSSAAATSERLGFLGQAAYHLMRLGRVRQQAGDGDAAAETLDRAIAAAETGGDPRMAATARINLARVHRAAGRRESAVELLTEADRWYRGAGGGDGALMTRGLLAAMTSPADDALLESVLAEARGDRDVEVEVVMLDALARTAAEHADPGRAEDLLRQADEVFPAVAHVIDDADRIDAHAARMVLAPSPGNGP